MIVFVDKNEINRYERFVSTHPKGHFLQSLKWAEFKKPQKHAAVMSVDDNGRVRGALSLFVHPERFFKASVLYAPRGPVCDADDVVAIRELFEGAKEIAKKHHAYKLTLDPDITTEDTELMQNLKAVGVKKGDDSKDNALLQPFSVYRLDVKNKSEDELLSSFQSKARYDVRSALKKGAVCREGGRNALAAFHALLTETAEKDGFTPRSLEYFERLYDALAPENLKLFMVEFENTQIAGSVLIRYGNKSWHMYAGSRESHKHLLPNYLMQWEMIRWSSANGCEIYDMRGIAGEHDKTTPLEGLERFKRRFGGELVKFAGRLDVVYNPTADAVISMLKTIKRIPGRILNK